MFKGILLFFVLGVGVFLFTNNSLAALWDIERVDSARDVGLGSSMAIDSSDVIHISYIDNRWPSDSKLKYAYKVYGGTWHIELIDNNISNSPYAAAKEYWFLKSCSSLKLAVSALI